MQASETDMTVWENRAFHMSFRCISQATFSIVERLNSIDSEQSIIPILYNGMRWNFAYRVLRFGRKLLTNLST